MLQYSFYALCQKAPVALTREVDGFIINRLQYALLMEAYRLVEVMNLSHEMMLEKKLVRQ